MAFITLEGTTFPEKSVFDDARANDVLFVLPPPPPPDETTDEQDQRQNQSRLLIGHQAVSRSALRVHGEEVHVDDMVTSNTLRVLGRLGVGRAPSADAIVDSRGNLFRLTGVAGARTEMRIFGNDSRQHDQESANTECVFKCVSGTDETSSKRTTEFGTSFVHPVFIRNAGEKRLVIDDEGKTGLGGVIEPDETLDVGGTTLTTRAKIRSGTTGIRQQSVEDQGPALDVFKDVTQEAAFTDAQGHVRKHHAVRVAHAHVNAEDDDDKEGEKGEERTALVVTGDSGFVGLNTDFPDARLHVVGSTKIEDSLHVEGGTFLRGRAVPTEEDEDPADPRFAVLRAFGQESVEPTFYVNGEGFDRGRVGVGTSAPEGRLDVRGDLFATEFVGSGAAITNLDVDNVASGTLRVDKGGTGTSSLQKDKFLVGPASINGNGSGSDVAVRSPTELHWDAQNARMGILTSNPESALDVKGTVTGTAFRGDGNAISNLDMDAAGTGTLSVERGGTGTTSHAAERLLVGKGTDAVDTPDALRWDASSRTLDVDGEVRATTLSGDGRAVTGIDIGNVTVGVLPVGTGGTGTDAHTPGKVLVGDGSNAVLSPASLHWDGDARRLGINVDAPAEDLDVAGRIRAAGFVGDGSNITHLDVDAAKKGTLSVERGGTGASAHTADKLLVGRGTDAIASEADLHWDGDLRRLGVRTASPSAEFEVNGVVAAHAFVGDGSNVTNLDVDHATSGTLDVRRGGTGTQHHTADKLLVGSGADAVRGPVDLHWNAEDRRLGVNTDAPETELDVAGSVRADAFRGEGSAVTNLNLDHGGLGTLVVERGGTGKGTHAAGRILVGDGSNPVQTPDELVWDSSDGGRLRVQGKVQATSFHGSLNMDDAAAGVLSVERGGTGKATHDVGKVLVGDGSTSVKTPSALHWDDANVRLGINTAAPEHSLDVDGDIRALSLAGDGSNLTNIDVDHATLGTLDVRRGGTGTGTLARGKLLVGEGEETVSTPSALHWDAVSGEGEGKGRLGIHTAEPSVPLHVRGDTRVEGTLTATFLEGDGSAIQGLDMDHATDGILDVARGGTGTDGFAADKLVVGSRSGGSGGSGGSDASKGSLQSPAQLHWDGSNARLGINTSSPARALEVVGDVQATSFVGDGADLVNLNVDHATAGTLPVERGGTGRETFEANRLLVGNASDALLCPQGLRWEGDEAEGRLTVTSHVSAGSFLGDGSNLTNLDMDHAALGTLATERGGTGRDTFEKDRLLVGDGSNAVYSPTGLYWNTSESRLDVTSHVSAESFTGDGSNVTNLDVDHVSLGVLAVNHGGTGTDALTENKVLVGGTTTVTSPSALHWDADSGRLGVKTDLPNAEVDVNGSLTTMGTISSMADGRLQDNLSLISSAVDKVKQIRGYTFDVPGDGTTRRYTGVLGEDVKAVLPEAVTERSDGYLSVAYGNLVGLAFEAIRTLAEEVALLKQ